VNFEPDRIPLGNNSPSKCIQCTSPAEPVHVVQWVTRTPRAVKRDVRGCRCSEVQSELRSVKACPPTKDLLPTALRAAQACRYLIYSEADFEIFRPAAATRCTDGGEIWHGGGDLLSPPPCQISPHRCNAKGVGPQKLKFLLRFDQNVEYV